MVIGFKHRFVEPILARLKIHTIRKDNHNRWREGMKMHMATGVRTKMYNQFNEDTCKSVQEIEIIRVSDELNETIVKVDGRVLSEHEVYQLARNDGFENIIDFWMWFADGFKGKIIHWTEYRY